MIMSDLTSFFKITRTIYVSIQRTYNAYYTHYYMVLHVIYAFLPRGIARAIPYIIIIILLFFVCFTVFRTAIFLTTT